MAHTPGPWKIDTKGQDRFGQQVWVDSDSDGPFICQCVRNSQHTELDNARLIAAAPDLLTALRAVMDAVDTFGLKPTCTCRAMKPGHVCPYCQARATIAKVTA